MSVIMLLFLMRLITLLIRFHPANVFLPLLMTQSSSDKFWDCNINDIHGSTQRMIDYMDIAGGLWKSSRSIHMLA